MKKIMGNLELLKAIAHPARSKIIELLIFEFHAEACSVNSLQKKLNLSHSTVSQHLHFFNYNRLIDRNEIGPEVCYSVTDERVVSILKIWKKRFA